MENYKKQKHAILYWIHQCLMWQPESHYGDCFILMGQKKDDGKLYGFLTLQGRRTFKFLPSPQAEDFKFPTSSAPTSIHGLGL